MRLRVCCFSALLSRFRACRNLTLLHACSATGDEEKTVFTSSQLFDVKLLEDEALRKEQGWDPKDETAADREAREVCAVRLRSSGSESRLPRPCISQIVLPCCAACGVL